jgi:hypothetical protein
MTSAAWAFVRPYEITKGAQAAQTAQNLQDKFAVDMAQAQEQNAYLAQQRALQLEQQRQQLEYTRQLNPIQLQQQQLNLSNQGMVNANNTENFQVNQWKLAATKALQVDQNPGDSEDTVFKSMLNRVENMQDPNIKFHAVQQLKEKAQSMALAALNKGDVNGAQNILLYMNNGPIPTTAAISAMTPGQQVALVTNNRVTGQMPDPKVTMEMLKHKNEMELKKTPTGDGQVKAVMDEANRNAPITVAKAQELYAEHVNKANQTGIKAMTLDEFLKMLGRQAAVGQLATGNAVTSGRSNPIGPGGVPYK